MKQLIHLVLIYCDSRYINCVTRYNNYFCDLALHFDSRFKFEEWSPANIEAVFWKSGRNIRYDLNYNEKPEGENLKSILLVQ